MKPKILLQSLSNLSAHTKSKKTYTIKKAPGFLQGPLLNSNLFNHLAELLVTIN
jgi:hypothetical protein